MENDKFVYVLSKRVNDLSKNQELMVANKDLSDAILINSIRNLNFKVSVLSLCVGTMAGLGLVSGLLYLSHEAKQDKKLDILHKFDSDLCSKTCILHKFENENESVSEEKDEN